ncbi:histidine phosphatase superfamily [Mycena albidolilacea]|uniref:Histidine phosphatase superfamily n=1 Tax=Mycena albidolilacea TaxID=1033008 RepID=A0AAD7AS30_9AGAR|nr:histidine phosphatase superfamily [Mycena albidolilacea]
MSRIRATFTFIRHGESTDNLRAVWAGWADATLTNHGMNQAQAVGASLSATQFAAIYSSPLKRTYMTAQAIQSQQQTGSPSVVTSPLFREQYFGVAEGKPSTRKKDPDISLAEQFERGIYPGSLSRSERFPEGESLDEVQERASKGWAEILLPYVQEKARQDNNQVHVAVISHGLFIKEAIRALAKYDRTADLSACDYQWLRNTAWARVVVEMKAFPKEEEPVFSPSNLLLERVQLTHFNQCEHLATVTRQKGGTGREAYDKRQKDIRGFFGAKSGGGKSKGL